MEATTALKLIVSEGAEGAEENVAWAGVLLALGSALTFETSGQGRPPKVEDEALLATYQRLKTVRAVCKELGYSDHYRVANRLRAMGAVIKPGRPKTKLKPP
jgi:hypothetical protein